MILDTIPYAKTFTLVVGTSVRKSLPVLQAYLQSLAWQELPPNVKVTYVFCADWETPDSEAEAYLRQWVAERGGMVFSGHRGGGGDYADAGGATHQWTASSMARVGANKNELLQRALGMGADGVWLVDADLICDVSTLRSLWDCNAPIACAVYWTHWHRSPAGDALSAAPQVWLRHPYQLDGRGIESWQFRKALLERQRVKVWGQGACTLIRSEVLQKGVNFAYIPGISMEGMMAGEDRHFCLRAEALHCDMFADAWPDIFHIYHDSDLPQVPEMLARLSAPHPDKAGLNDLVNLTLECLEPVPHAGQFQGIPPTHARGRLGRLGLLPELEIAVTEMKRGTTTTVPVHFPAHFPLEGVRGQRRLIRVTLNDCKPWGFPPVVENELLYGAEKGLWLDPTQYTAQQVHALVGA